MHSLFISLLLILGSWTLSKEGSLQEYPATVPSTVAGVLLDNGVKVDDKSIFDDAWVYTCNFDLTSKDLAKFHRLRFDGLNYRADVYLNSTCLASADTTYGVFCVREFDVTKLLKKHNVLKVRLTRAHSGDLNIGFVDWNPRPADESMGIVRDVTLYETGSVAVTDLFVKPELNLDTDESADLEVRVTLRNMSRKPVNGEVRGRWAGGEFMFPVSLAASETKEVVLTPKECKNLHTAKPSIWWTRDLGKPYLYTMQASFVAGKETTDSREVKFGIRKIESRIDSHGHRVFLLNGKKILIKGAGWTDNVNLRDTHESLDAQMEHVLNMGLNTIRFENIWGKDQYIYDLCDQNGVMALVGWSCQWDWENYCGLPETDKYGCINDETTMKLAARYFRDQVKWLRNHPSVIGWMTGSDRIPNPELETEYLRIYSELDYRPYINSAKAMTSKISGKSGTKMEGPYEYVGPDYWYYDTEAGGAFGFNTETGVGANWPQIETIRTMIPESELWPLGPAYSKYCTTSSSAMNSTKMLESVVNAQYGEADGIEDFTRKAHAADYDATRAMFEAFRVNLPNTTGIVQWMLNSACPSLYWQLYDNNLTPTASYYGVKKACAPIQLIFNYKDYKVYAVNESSKDKDIKAYIKVYDAQSNLLVDTSDHVGTERRHPKAAFDLDSLRGRDIFVALRIRDGQDNFYCIPAKMTTYKFNKTNWYVTPAEEYADMHFVSDMPRAAVSYKVVESVDNLGKLWTVTLTNDSDYISYQNVLKLVRPDGSLLEPAIWSDNFVAVLPHSEKIVTCRCDRKENARVAMTGWNTDITLIPDDNTRDKSKYAEHVYGDGDKYTATARYDVPVIKEPKGKKVKNVIMMIGDGMGLEQISCAWVANGGHLYLDNFPVVGLSRTYATDKLITDSSAGGSALATGVKTRYGFIAVDEDGLPVKSILADAHERGLRTGVSVVCRIGDATPAAFCNHSITRYDEEGLAAQYLDCGADFLIGGGIKFFKDRSDGRDIVEEMKAKGYNFVDTREELAASNKLPILGLFADTEMAPALDRGPILEESAVKALELLDNDKGFFLMIEGSSIDDHCHHNQVGYAMEELFDFDKTIGKVLEWAAKDGETLVIVTADHATGGLTLLGGSLEKGEIKVNFSTSGHNGIMVPVYAFGPHSEDFSGTMENAEVANRIKAIFK